MEFSDETSILAHESHAVWLNPYAMSMRPIVLPCKLRNSFISGHTDAKLLTLLPILSQKFY